MRPHTIRALLAIDQRFYDAHAHGFAGSRRLAWKGWTRALAHAVPGTTSSIQVPGTTPIGTTPIRVLDVGCAHARLADHLVERTARPIDYLGLDRNVRLLARAPRRDGLRTIAGDLIGGWPITLRSGVTPVGFDLVTLFGVLHHIPGRDTRVELVDRLTRLLAPGGCLVMTAWRVERQPRFAHKRIAWRDYNRTAEEPVDRDDLEPGDHLLSWGHDRVTPRYCHAMDDAEADALAASTGLEAVDRFEADGHHSDRNLYWVLRASVRAASSPVQLDA